LKGLEMDIEKLEKWVNEHPAEADLEVMNVSTGKTSTVREVLDTLKTAKAKGVEVLDLDILEVVENINQWLEEE